MSMTKMSAESAFWESAREGQPLLLLKELPRRVTYLGESVEPHNESTGSEKHPLDALHILQAPLKLPISNLLLGIRLLFFSTSAREERGIVPCPPPPPRQRLELQSLALERREGREGRAESLGRFGGGEGEAPGRAVESRLSLYGPAGGGSRDLVALDAGGGESSLSAGRDGLLELEGAGEGESARNLDYQLLEPKLDGRGGAIIGGESGGDGGPETG